MDKGKATPEKDENGLQGEGDGHGHDYTTGRDYDSRDKPRSEDRGVLRSLATGHCLWPQGGRHKDGRVVLGALRIVSHEAHKHSSGGDNPDSWGDAEGRKDGSRNGPNNGRDSGHYTLNDGHIDSAGTLVGDHNIPVVDQVKDLDV